VLSQLPPKVYSVRRVDIPPEWRRAYDGMAADMLAELPDGEELPVMSVLAQLTRLSQLAGSAADVERRTEYNELGQEVTKYDVTLRAPSWKADALLEILAERKGQQVAVFGVSRQLVTIAGKACEEAGYRCGYILGGQGKIARRTDIDAFQGGKLDVILATAGAGSLGITLTAAGTVVMLQRSWELDKAVQPEDRAHRLDDIVLKHDCIEIIDVLARNTVDDRVRELLRVKGGSLAELVQDKRLVLELLGGLH
jgi:SNF2 family DNA or RNA helicase